MKIYTTFIFFMTLCFFANAAAAQPNNLQTVQDFEHVEALNNPPFSESLRRELGSKALFTAKILRIDLESLHIGENAVYFRLPNNNDVCRQLFFNEAKYRVQTKCYRGERELINFTKTFVK